MGRVIGVGCMGDSEAFNRVITSNIVSFMQDF
jgi:hypothetical protein